MAAPLLSSFSWSACFPDAARREAAPAAVFDAGLFADALRRFAECGARHAEALRGKSEKEGLAQRHYDRLFKVHVSLAHLQGERPGRPLPRVWSAGRANKSLECARPKGKEEERQRRKTLVLTSFRAVQMRNARQSRREPQ